MLSQSEVSVKFLRADSDSPFNRLQRTIGAMKPRREIRAAIAWRALTQRVLASRLGWSESTLSRILTGRRRASAGERRRIAFALGLRPDVVRRSLAILRRRGRGRDAAGRRAARPEHAMKKTARRNR